MYHLGCNGHLILFIQCDLPEILIMFPTFWGAFDLLTNDLSILLKQVSNSKHLISAWVLADLNKLHFPVDPDIRFIIDHVAYHVPGIHFLLVKWVFITPYIRWHYVRIRDPVSYKCKGTEIVFWSIIRIDHKFYPVFIDQIIKFLFHESHNNCYIPYPDFVELFDSAFYQRLAIDLKHCFGRSQIYGYHSHSKPCCKYDRIFRSFHFKLSDCFRCKTNSVINVALIFQGF